MACGLLLAALLPACSSDEGNAAGFEPLKPPGPNPKSEIRNPKSKNPLAFTAETLDGWTFHFAERNARRRIVVYLFDAAAPAAERFTPVAQRLHAGRLASNLEVVGVVVPPGYTPLAARRVPVQRPAAPELAKLARAHLAKLGADFPCVLDPDGTIVESYTLAWGMSRLDELPAFYPFPIAAADSERPIFPRHAAKSPDPADYLLRRVLRRYDIEPPADVDPLLGDCPPAPDFSLTDTAGKTHTLRDYKGRVLLVVLFARDCPRCKDLLTFLGRAYGEFGPSARKQAPWLDVLAVCTDVSGEPLRALVAERSLAFPTAGDPDWAFRTAFRYRGSVPDTFVVGPDGRILYRHRDFAPRHLALIQMEITTLLGVPTRPLLERGAFSSDEACRVCHPGQHADWTLTRHACAWETIVRLGKEGDPECVRCHVVGYRQGGGFVSVARTPHLADVQCESCHGANGCAAVAEQKAALPVPTPQVKNPVKPEACLFCHDVVHSPRFDFASYRARILHDQRGELLKLPRAEREARLRRACAGANEALFDPTVPYIGSAACGKCHPTEYNALKGGFHAKALDALAKPAPDTWSVPKHKRGVIGAGKPECLRCHTTGYGRPGGYPADAGKSEIRNPKSEMGGVGCEACHGPGKAHADDPKKPRAILRFGATCPECAVLPTCRQCHDEANDPAFDYRTALPKARHPVGKAVQP